MDEFMERNYKKRAMHDALVRVSDLNYKIREYGRRFIILALLFYICVPLFYYYLYLDWTAIDAFYFSFVTFSTVGYGDIIPHTVDQRMITCTLIIFGVAITANIVGIIAALHSEDLEEAKQAAIDARSAVNVSASAAFAPSDTDHLQDADEGGGGPKSSLSSITDSAGAPSIHAREGLRTKHEAAFPVLRRCLDAIGRSRVGAVWWWLSLQWGAVVYHVRSCFDWATGYYEPPLIAVSGAQQRDRDSEQHERQSGASADSEFRNLSTPRLLTTQNVKAVNRIRRIIRSYYRELQDLRWMIFSDFCFLWTIVLVGIFCMRAIEGFRPADAFYWAIVTVTTVGYGDVVPVTTGGKAFTIVYIMLGTVLMGKTLGNIVMAPMAIRSKKNEITVMAQFELNLSEHQLHALLNNELTTCIPHFYQSEQQISKAEFMLNVLRMMSKVNDEDLLVAAEVTDRYCDGGATPGSVTVAELQNHIVEARLEAEERRRRDREKLQQLAAQDGVAGGGRSSFFDGVRDTFATGGGAVHNAMLGRVTETEMRASNAGAGGRPAGKTTGV